MDLIAARLHAIVKEAPLEECKKALQNMPLSQAAEHLKKMYSTDLQRKEKIDNLANIFPDRNIEAISKALEISKDDEEAALQYLLYHPPSLKENKKSEYDVEEDITVIEAPKRQNNIKLKTSLWGTLHNPIKKKAISSIQPSENSLQTSISPSINSGGLSTKPPLPFIYSRKKKRPESTEKKIETKKLYEFQSTQDDSSEYEEEEEFFESNGTPLKTERIDLHGLLRKDAQFLVESKIIHAKENGIGLFLFICGKGNHSVNNVAILKPMVIDVCKKLDVHGYVSEVNPGVIICDVNQPFQA